MEKIRLTFSPETKNYGVYFFSQGRDVGKYIGRFSMLEDGFYSFWPADEQFGCWDSYALRWIADRLDEVNKPWNDQINEYFENDKKRNSEEAI